MLKYRYYIKLANNHILVGVDYIKKGSCKIIKFKKPKKYKAFCNLLKQKNYNNLLGSE